MHVQTIVELSEREEGFVMALARGLPPTRAATASGWSAPHARALLQRPQIAAAVKMIAANLVAVVARYAPAANEAEGRRDGPR